MAPSANTQIAAIVDAARDIFLTRPQMYVAQMRGKLNDLSGTNFEMACTFAERGDWRDAAVRFRITVKLDPTFVQAWHNLGICLIQLQDREKAAEAFRRVLALKPQHEEARFLLASVNPAALPREQWPTRMPRTMVERFFGAAAPFYVQMENQNQYAGPVICEQKLQPHLAGKTGLHVIDLGCGVGLASTVWRSKAANIIGVDVVPGMVQHARNMMSSGGTLFNEVIEGDIYASDSIGIAENSADIVLLCNVSQYLGELNSAMKGMQRWLKSGGLAAITVEPAPAQAVYGVNAATGRFGHSAAYLQEEAKTYGFSVLTQERVNLYPDIAAGIVILRKN